MPELRKDPIVGRWVIIAPERLTRPHTIAPLAPHSSEAFDPLLAGNEDATPPHILAHVFKELTGADFPIALYRGGSPAMSDLIANQVHAMFQPTTIVIPILDDKRVRVLGIATEQRSRTKSTRLPSSSPDKPLSLPTNSRYSFVRISGYNGGVSGR